MVRNQLYSQVREGLSGNHPLISRAILPGSSLLPNLTNIAAVRDNKNYPLIPPEYITPSTQFLQMTNLLSNSPSSSHCVDIAVCSSQLSLPDKESVLSDHIYPSLCKPSEIPSDSHYPSVEYKGDRHITGT